jgi:hypothetical protein
VVLRELEYDVLIIDARDEAGSSALPAPFDYAMIDENPRRGAAGVQCLDD